MFVAPSHYEGLGIGVAILAYTLGLAAMLIWRYRQIEQEWTARLQPGTPGGMVREPPGAEGGEPPVIFSVRSNLGGA